MKFISLVASYPPRRANLQLVRDNYLQALQAVKGQATFEWHLVYWDTELKEMGDLAKELEPMPTRIYGVPVSDKKIHPAFPKSNAVLDILCKEGFDDPDTFICTMADDDLLSKNVFVKLKAGYEKNHKPMLIISAARGQEIGPSGHGPWNLLAAPEAMKQCYVTGEQYWTHCGVFSGKWEAPRRLPDDDGLFAEWLHKEHPDWFEFIPDAWMLFNGLEQGRWTNLDELHKYLNL